MEGIWRKCKHQPSALRLIVEAGENWSEPYTEAGMTSIIFVVREKYPGQTKCHPDTYPCLLLRDGDVSPCISDLAGVIGARRVDEVDETEGIWQGWSLTSSML